MRYSGPSAESGNGVMRDTHQHKKCASGERDAAAPAGQNGHCFTACPRSLIAMAATGTSCPTPGSGFSVSGESRVKEKPPCSGRVSEA